MRLFLGAVIVLLVLKKIIKIKRVKEGLVCYSNHIGSVTLTLIC